MGSRHSMENISSLLSRTEFYLRFAKKHGALSESVEASSVLLLDLNRTSGFGDTRKVKRIEPWLSSRSASANTCEAVAAFGKRRERQIWPYKGARGRVSVLREMRVRERWIGEEECATLMDDEGEHFLSHVSDCIW